MRHINSSKEITQEAIDSLYITIKKDAEASGYNLNPDEQFAKDLVRGLIINQKRYGYPSCPCRLSEGISEKDRDIICPCDYRDADINDYDACYCGLYVSADIVNGSKKLAPIPERRYAKSQKVNKKAKPGQKITAVLNFPVHRCRVCGYLCAREKPPEVCPICKAKKDRFEIFI
ncbi:MAG: ferredoxin:glutaredoxin reductase [Actinobacteria bacterium]|nr:ferredoxin:glutaredoxin reductase [Actinomycetota bacterium]